VVLGMNEEMIVADPGQLVNIPIKIQASKEAANKKIHTIEVAVKQMGDDVDEATEKVKYFGYKK